MDNSHRLAYLLLTVMAFFLACNYIIGRFVHAEIPPIGLSFWRWFFAAIVLLPFVLRRKNAFCCIFQNNIAKLLPLSALLMCATSLVLFALHSTSAINMSIINSSQPVLTVIFTRLFLKQRLVAIQLAGIFFSSIGVLIMIAKGQLDILINFQFNEGDLIALLAMCAFATYAINMQRIPEELNIVESLFCLSVLGCLILLPFYLLESFFYKVVPFNLTSLWAISVMAILVSVFSMLIWNHCNKIVGPARATVFVNLIPVFGVLLATSMLGEKFLQSHAIGAVFIIIGVSCVIKSRFEH